MLGDACGCGDNSELKTCDRRNLDSKGVKMIAELCKSVFYRGVTCLTADSRADYDCMFILDTHDTWAI